MVKMIVSQWKGMKEHDEVGDGGSEEGLVRQWKGRCKRMTGWVVEEGQRGW